MEDVPSDPPDEEFPGPSERSPRRKRRSRRRRGTPQPDVGTFFKTACSEPSFRVYDHVRSVVPSSLPSQLNARPVTLPAVQSAAQLPAVQSAAQLPAVQSAAQLPAVQSAAQLPAVLLASPPPITPSLQSSPLPVAQLPLVHLSAHSLIQSPSSPSRYEQGTHFTTTSAGSLKLVTSETVAPSRASPEAGCRSPADSEHLEVKTPAPAVSPGNSPEQSRLSAPPESSSEFTRPPQSSAECIGEHFQPSEDCIPLLLPESSHCAAQFQPVSTLAEVCVPASSVSVSTGGPEEPVQSQATLAGGSGEPRQHPASSAGGSGEPSQPQVSFAGGPESPVQSQAMSAGGPESPVRPQVSSAGDSREPSSASALPSPGPASSDSSTPGPASSDSSTPGPASSDPSTPGPASSKSGPASSGPASSTPGPASVSSSTLLLRHRLALRLPRRHGTQLVLFRLPSAGRFPGL
ncbi:flocculation protein FLO11-like [Oreochromis niloticus]|uniref:flocculation protein FLO11-like n=1 Tax=Oreochromis niloticus TaxID=8128 RepID=UPI000DF1DCA6|nr:flocculation protein FLO11-like [Oreochromis niloticus]